MKTAAVCLALLALFVPPALPDKAAAQPAPTEAADQLFRSGAFVGARAAYERVVADNPQNYEATLQLGYIALLSNRLDEAEDWLKKASALKPGEETPKIMLAQALYRDDDFQGAADALDGVDVAASKLIAEQFPTLNVAKLRSFAGQVPYQVDSPLEVNRIKFLRTDPLPLVSIAVNGREGIFFIDTGGSEIGLDSEFAKELGVPSFGAIQGTFSGGQNAEVTLGRVDSVTLGDWTLKNVPVATMPFRQLSEGLGVKQIDGVIGTTLFYHFLTTLDFKGGELVLRRRTAKNFDAFLAEAKGSIAVPFWMASDHFMVARGRVNALPPTLLFVDTGLAGAGIKLAQSVIEKAGIKLEEDKAETGAGAGGTLRTVPYVVDRVSFGDVVEEKVAGLFDGPFPWETMFGFELAGMVGHDFFMPFSVTFDFDGMRIYLAR